MDVIYNCCIGAVCEGRKVEVRIFSNGDKVELRLNGKSLGIKKVKGCVAKFIVTVSTGGIESKEVVLYVRER